MSARAFLLKHALLLKSRAQYRSFRRALNTPVKVQRDLLKKILTEHESTEYGKKYDLYGQVDREEFRNRTPLSSFDTQEFVSLLEKQRAHPRDAIVVPNGVEVFEKTSGSSGVAKYIPYNRALLRSFERYFTIWMHDVLRHHPQLKSLRTFMSVSPSIKSSESENGVQVGLQDDSEYLSPLLRYLLQPFFSVPLDFKAAANSVEFWDVVSAYLVSDEDLEIISVWHPSFMEILWRHILERRTAICDMLMAGQVYVEGKVYKFSPSRNAISLLAGADTFKPHDLWPRIKFVSAWASGSSVGPAKKLEALFPNARFQPKGLLATEFPGTLPLEGVGCVPFLTDVFFEFEQSGRFYWLEELRRGELYSLIVTQRGGLLRYQTHDLVKVTGHMPSGTPLLDFVARMGETSDLVGEKLSASYLVVWQEEFFKHFGKAAHLCFLPQMKSGYGYGLLFDFEEPSDANEVGRWWEDCLRKSYHYNYARSLGQLNALQARCVPNLAKRLRQYYELRQKAGDIKLKILVCNADEANDIWREL